MELDFWGTAWEVLIWFSNVQTETDRKRKGKKERSFRKLNRKRTENLQTWMNEWTVVSWFWFQKRLKKLDQFWGKAEVGKIECSCSTTTKTTTTTTLLTKEEERRYAFWVQMMKCFGWWWWWWEEEKGFKNREHKRRKKKKKKQPHFLACDLINVAPNHWPALRMSLTIFYFFFLFRTCYYYFLKYFP